MRAVVYDRHGPARDVLRIVDVPKPAPSAGEVLVRMMASGVNPSDVKKRAGWRNPVAIAAPVTPHSDGAGIIEGVGDGVSANWIGRRVWIFNAQGGSTYGSAGSPECGTASEYAALPLPFVVPLPDNVSFETGACLGVPACTAHYAVFADGSVDGKTMLVQGGAGCVGELAIQFAALAGATVLATVSSPEKAEVATRAGARHTILRHGADVGRAVRNLVPDGVDRIIEVDFGANAAIDAVALKRGGMIASYSSPSDPTPAIPYYPLQFTAGTIRFVPIFLIDESHRRRGLAEINYALSRNELRPTIAKVLDFEDVTRAHEMVERGTTIGNVVLRM
jgi:NADPH:quinone reductase-like Zn-dependent oxidoreductase